MEDQKKNTSKNSGGVGNGKFIIVAEDDKFYGQIFKTKLEKEGYKVIVAEDGQQALDAMRKDKPGLLLLDLIMPIKDGFETLKELKSDDNLKDLQVLVLSNLGQDEDIERAKKLGALDYLVKTDVSIQEVIGKIEQYYKK